MADYKLDINTASAEQIRDTCGVGESVAHAIVEARSHGEFGTLDEVGTLPGVGQRSVEKMREHGCGPSVS